MEVGCIAGENDHAAGRICFQLIRVELIAESDVENAGDHSVDAILGMPVRHQLYAVGNFDSDDVGLGLQRLTDNDRKPGLAGTPGKASIRCLQTESIDRLPGRDDASQPPFACLTFNSPRRLSVDSCA